MSPARRTLLIITARDAAAYVGSLFDSLAAQTHPDWRAVYVDDASGDGTPAAVRAEIEGHQLGPRVTFVRNRQRLYKARNVYQALREVGHDGDVVAILDGDDRLADPHALAILDREHGRGWEVVWSNWVGSDGSTGNSAPLNPLIPFRRQPFVTSHLFSFRKELFDDVDESELQDEEGRWFREGCDVAIAWAVLARTRRRRFINRPLYAYNRQNPLSHKPSGRKRDQIRTLALLRRRGRTTSAPADLRFVVGHLGYFARCALSNASQVRRFLRNERRVREFWRGANTID